MLSLKKQIWYGMGGVTISLSDLVIMQWLLVRYLPPDKPHLVPAALMGVLLFIGRIVEGISFALVAHWSDQLDSRWGRRMPFLRGAVVPFGLLFFLLFTPPVDHYHWANSVYAAVTILLYFAAYGAVVVPYLALLPELTYDLKERLNLITWQSIFTLLATLAFAMTGFALSRVGWVVVMGAAAFLSIVFFIPVCTAFREEPSAARAETSRLTLWASIRLALENRPFRYALVSIGVFWFALNGLTALVPYWVVVYLGRSEDDVAKVMILYILMSLVSFIAINWLAARYGKHVMLLISYLAGAVLFASLALVGVSPFGSDFVQTMIILALCGVPVAGFTVLAFPLLADVVDHDEQLTGRRREAIFYGVKGVFQKVLIGLSILTFTLVPYLGSDGTRMLREDGWLSFTGVYTANGATPLTSTPTAPHQNTLRSVYIEPRPTGIQAPWVLTGPDGLQKSGEGAAVVSDLAPGFYRLEWGAVPGWTTPTAERSPTAFGLKLMAIVCGLASAVAFLLFARYPLRERDGKVVLAVAQAS